MERSWKEQDVESEKDLATLYASDSQNMVLRPLEISKTMSGSPWNQIISMMILRCYLPFSLPSFHQSVYSGSFPGLQDDITAIAGLTVQLSSTKPDLKKICKKNVK